jgi:hypothetical protein
VSSSLSDLRTARETIQGASPMPPSVLPEIRRLLYDASPSVPWTLLSFGVASHEALTLASKYSNPLFSGIFPLTAHEMRLRHGAPRKQAALMNGEQLGLCGKPSSARAYRGLRTSGTN